MQLEKRKSAWSGFSNKEGQHHSKVRKEAFMKKLISIVFVLVGLSLVTGSAVAEALKYAAFKGDIKAVEDLLNKGADVNEKDSLDETALMTAASRGHTDIVELLIEKGANVNEKGKFGDTALMFAALNGHTKIVKLLIEKGANVNEKTGNGHTALMSAAIGGHKKIAKLLIEKGADVDIAIEGIEKLAIGHPRASKLKQDIELLKSLRPNR
jgi:ankyrin repeat protein